MRGKRQQTKVKSHDTTNCPAQGLLQDTGSSNMSTCCLGFMAMSFIDIGCPSSASPTVMLATSMSLPSRCVQWSPSSSIGHPGTSKRLGGGACLVTQYVAARSPAGQAPAAATIRVPAQVSSRHRQGQRNRTGGSQDRATALGLTPMARAAGRNPKPWRL